MAVRNGGTFLHTALKSILAQTYENFEFLIIDDASNDDTADRVRSCNDPRIELIQLPQNVGQTAALNIGLRHIHTPWIARMDADDFSAPTRLAEQMELIRSDPSLSCVGTFAWVFRKDPAVVEEILTRPIGDAEIKKAMLREPSIIHGSFIVSREAILEAGGYDERYRYAADFDLYERLVTPKRRVANIPKPLLGIRRHDKQDSRSIFTIEEGIDIYKRRLAQSRYTSKERAIVRSALSFYYLLRIRYRLKNRKLDQELFGDIARAFRTSPVTFIRYVPEGLLDLWT